MISIELLFFPAAVIGLYYGFNQLHGELLSKKKDVQTIDFLFYLSNATKTKPLIHALKESNQKGFELINQEFNQVLKEVSKGASLKKSIREIKNRNKSKTVNKTIDFILLGLESGINLSKLLHDSASHLIKLKQLTEEKNSSLLIHKYSLILIALFLMPLILGMISQIVNSFDLEMLSLLNSSVNTLELKQKSLIAQQAVMIYLVEFSFITAFFLSLLEQKKSKLLIYGFLFSIVSVTIFNFFG